MGITQNTGLKATSVERGYGRIGVLMGGASTERNISLKSGKAIFESLKGIGLDTVAIDIKTDKIKENSELIKSKKIDCAFLALHGKFGEDGQIQGILDVLGVPYTGSGKLASHLAMDKLACRKILQVYGLAVPRYKQVNNISFGTNSINDRDFNFPIVVKPISQGSSIGLSIVESPDKLRGAIKRALEFDKDVLIEEYIKGREVTVGILNDSPLPIVEIVPKRDFFDYQAKYTPGMTEYVVPARIEGELAGRIQSQALEAHRLLGCRGYSRVDIILSQDNTPFILEINTTPGFTRTSLFPKAAKVNGVEFTQLCLELVRLAYEKAQS